MRDRFVRSMLVLLPMALLAACGQAEQPVGESASSSDLAVPDIARSSAARRVAFQFDFTFALPARSIARVQRKHVSACEQLGTERCKIVGVSFDQQNSDEANGSLSLLLAPTDAYRFTGSAVDAVEAAKGEVERALVEGHDAGGAIEQANVDKDDINTEIARIGSRLKLETLTPAERRDLSAKLEQLHNSTKEQAQALRQNTGALAITPVSFRYVDQGALRGENRFLRAAGHSWSGVQDALVIGLILLGYVLPWGLLIGGAAYLFRLVSRRRRQGTPE